MNIRSIILMVFLFSTVYAAKAEVLYNFIDLGTHPNGIKGIATHINNSGQVVGYGADSENHDRAILFDITGQGNNIDLCAPGDTSGVAWKISNNGIIVGKSTNGIHHATLFDSMGEGRNSDLGTIAVGSHSEAYSVNSSSQIVGDAIYAIGTCATLFDSSGNGNNINLGSLGGSHSGARSINEQGQIVGWGYTGDNYCRATLFDSSGNGQNVDLGTPGYTNNRSYAWSINELGQVVGEEAIGPTSYYRATLFDISGNGNNIDLGTLPGGQESQAHCINNHGQIVGWAKGNNIWQATLFDPTGSGMNLNLNDAIYPSLGYHLYEATSINDNGWIVGTAWTPSGEEMHAYLLIPIPEPATLSLLAFGGLALIRQRGK